MKTAKCGENGHIFSQFWARGVTLAETFSNISGGRVFINGTDLEQLALHLKYTRGFYKLRTTAGKNVACIYLCHTSSQALIHFILAYRLPATTSGPFISRKEAFPHETNNACLGVTLQPILPLVVLGM